MSDSPTKYESRFDERRRCQRMEIRLPVECRLERAGGPHIVRTVTRNIGTGGLYVELDEPDFSVGDVIDVQLTLPAAEGVSSHPGRASSRAEVLRVFSVGDEGSARFGIAAKFLDRLRTSF